MKSGKVKQVSSEDTRVSYSVRKGDKSADITIENIENGYLVTVSEWDDKKMRSNTKKFFSKEDPSSKIDGLKSIEEINIDSMKSVFNSPIVNALEKSTKK
mgnify:FL=1